MVQRLVPDRQVAAEVVPEGQLAPGVGPALVVAVAVLQAAGHCPSPWEAV